MNPPIIVIGAGQAGAQLVVSLRSEGYQGRLMLIGEESHPPYQRPPLSKQLLAGEMPPERVWFKPPAFYDQARVELQLGTRVRAIDRAARTVLLADGTALEYARLALAVGSRVRTLKLPGVELDGIHYLRTLDDMAAIRQRLQPGARLVVVGGGYVGLEVASVAVKNGLKVTVLEMASRLMQRVVGPVISRFYEQVHRAAGVEVRTDVRVTGFEGDTAMRRVVCEDGTTVAADAVLVGVGIEPNTELAVAAGLAVNDGIVVDEYTRTEDPDVVAAGDCTNHPNPHYRRRLRLESVPNALAQARAAAATLAGRPKPYAEIPWFWSDQYDLKLQIAGLIEGYDRVVVRGDPEQRQFMVCYLREGRLQAIESVNHLRDFALCKQLVARQAQVAPERLADADVPLKAL